MTTVYASIITIGDELLIGQTIDTNSAWMAQVLNEAGIWVHRRVAVGDERDNLVQALDDESRYSSIILLTGGLGPTADDITKPVLSAYFGSSMVVDQRVLDHVRYLFEKVFRRTGPVLERNLKQAEVPDSCTVLLNKRGTAPGMWFERNGKVFVSMPGVPNEMQGLMEEEVIPRLRRHFVLPHILHRTAFTAGMGESMIAERIRDFEAGLPPYIKLAYLPNYGMVRLRLTTIGAEKEKLENELDAAFATMRDLVRDILVAETDEGLEIVLGRILKEQHKSIGTAESCTGGFVAHLITSVPGSSAYFKGSVISYANSVKEEVLHVAHDTLETMGAVSEETVRQMVAGAIQVLGVDYAVATSGIMGPDGGTTGKPVGTVWIAAGNRYQTATQLLHLRFDRKRNIEIAATNALNLVRKFILAHG